MMNMLWKKLESFGFYAPLIAMYLISLPILSLSRLGLMIWQSERVLATGLWPEMLLQGFRIDIIQMGLLAIIPLLIAPVFLLKKTWGLWKIFTYLWVFYIRHLIGFFRNCVTWIY